MGHNWPSTVLNYGKPVTGQYRVTTGPELYPTCHICHLLYSTAMIFFAHTTDASLPLPPVENTGYMSHTRMVH